MRTSRRWTAGIAGLLVAALTLNACGNDTAVGDGNGDDAVAPAQRPADDAVGDDDAATDDRVTGEPGGDDAAAPADAVGTVEVDGVAYGVDTVVRCEPYDEVEAMEVELELQGRGNADGDRIQIDVYVQTIGGTRFDDVSWAGPEGVFGAQGEVDLDWTGDRVTGGAVLHDAREQVEQIELNFDLPVPDELYECR